MRPVPPTTGSGSDPEPRLPGTARALIALRGARSLGQGAFFVDLALYLAHLGWSGTQIGLVLTGGGLFTGALSLGVGFSSDRLTRKPFIVANECLTFAAAVTAFLAQTPWLLAIPIVLAGFGRGANGSAGPFAAAEQAWLAHLIPPKRRGRIFRLNTATGFFGMGAGALIAIFPGVAGLGLLGYRLLFILPMASSLFNLTVLSFLREVRPPPQAPAPVHHVRAQRRKENRNLTRLVLLNSVNGFAVGLIGPLMSYWLAVRFGVGPAAIAPVMGLAFAVTGVSSLVTGRLTERLGLVRSVVSLRSLGLILLAILPLMPTYALAALVYFIRSALNRGSVGARQAVVMSLVGDERRGWATSLNATSFQFPQAIGPVLAGTLIEQGDLILPFYLAFVLQLVYVVGYWRLFRHLESGPAPAP